jgi:transposase
MAGKRRNFSPQLKAQLVLQALEGHKTQAEICREHQIAPAVFARWKAEFLQQAHRAFQSDEQPSGESARIANLERLVGQLTLRLEIAKKASTLSAGTKSGDW